MASQTPNVSGTTVKSAPHGANVLGSGYGQTKIVPINDAETLLKESCQSTPSLKWDHIMQSSFQPHLGQPLQAPLYASSNGFVKGAIDAYNRHYHFVIRPDDVWFAILTQFSCYVNAHAEEMRSRFVAHEGQKGLEIEMTQADFGTFAELMSALLEKEVVDPELREWILPAFSTTTRDDDVVASILMMGTLQKYFTYKCCFMCGLPSVTLLGTEGDWENILLRLEKLKDYGEETTIWYNLLKPVLTRFVKTIQDLESEEVLDFWQRIVHYSSGGSGPTYLSGWLTAFCFWDQDGKRLYRDAGPPAAPDSDDSDEGSSFYLEEDEEMKAELAKVPDREKGWNLVQRPHLVLDGAIYPRMDLADVPAGYGHVPVHINDNGYEYDTTMVAGSVALKGTSSGRPLENGETGLDTLQPVSGWWIFKNPE